MAARPLAHRWLRAALVFVVLYALPYSTAQIPGVFDGPFDSPGVLQLLAVCLVFAGLAISYDLLFGHTGVMSFGHGMFVTVGVYVTTILVDHAGYGLWVSAVDRGSSSRWPRRCCSAGWRCASAGSASRW